MIRRLSADLLALPFCWRYRRRSAAAPSHEIYVTNELSGDLTIINGDTLKVDATIPLGKRPRGIETTRDGKHLFVALSGSPIQGPPERARPEGRR